LDKKDILELDNIRLSLLRYSIITSHILNLNYLFDGENFEILDFESNFNKKLISEMLHIKEQSNGINSQKDTELFDHFYYYLLDVSLITNFKFLI